MFYTCTCYYRYIIANNELDPETLCIDGKFNHFQQLQIRLDFVRYPQRNYIIIKIHCIPFLSNNRFALKDGQLWLGLNHALIVWESLAQNPVFPSDRDMCFKWFAKVNNFY